MLTNASIGDSPSWNQEILAMVTMVFIGVGDMIVSWPMVHVAEASVLFQGETPRIVYFQAEF